LGFDSSDLGYAYYVGGSAYGGFTGLVGLVRVYNAVLTPAQVTQNYNSIKNISGNPYSLP
jgi:hypothetical protein